MVENKTYILKDNGYFYFENVEDGDHALILKDSNGEKVASSIINIVSSKETKLSGNTLYINKDDKDINLNLKIDGDKISIETIYKGAKEEPKSNVVEKLENVVPTKTFDNLGVLYIVNSVNNYYFSFSNKI